MPPPAADGSPHAPQLECFGTGMEVECRVVVDNVDGHAAPPEIAAQEAAAAAAQQEAQGETVRAVGGRLRLRLAGTFAVCSSLGTVVGRLTSSNQVVQLHLQARPLAEPRRCASTC